jgi:diaminopimelate epimerase
LILIKPSDQQDFKMNFYNPDGSQSFCGNGARCAVHYSYENNIVSNNPCSFEAIDGLHQASICKNEVKIEMSHIGGVENVVVPSDDINEEGYFLDTGSPHFVHFVQHKSELDEIVNYGKRIRFSKRYESSGVNVNMVDVTAQDKILIRTYERGVENETLSCGTGATACALIYAQVHQCKNNLIQVETSGGMLHVSFDQFESGSFSNVYLIGPAKHVFNGQINV